MRITIGALLAALAVFSCSGETAGPNQRPVALAGPDLVVLVSETAELDGSGSYDPDGGDLDFFWELVAAPAGSRAALTPLVEGRAELTPDKDGIFLVRLIVSDGELISQPDVMGVRGLGRPCPYDADGDGHLPEACGGDDCDDGDENIHPGVFEGPEGAAVCGDGIDNDCDGQTDLDDPACSLCAQDSDCDDGAYCNGDETCDTNGVPPGTCQAGAVPCADAVDCTTDACDEGADTCSYTPDDSFCADGAVCNGVEWCDTQNGCQAGPNASPGTPCDDGNTCSVDDTCDGNGTCLPGPVAPEGPVCDANLTCHDGIDNDCDGATDTADDNCQGSGYICLSGPADPVSTGSSDTLTVALDAPGYDPEKIVCYTDTGRLLPGEVLFSNDFETDLNGFTISDPSRVFRTSAGQNPATSGSNGAFIIENGAPGWMESDRIDTTGRTRILLRYASQVVETEDNQGLEFFITEYSPDDGASWYVLDIQGDGFNQYYFQWFSHILPPSCENNPNLKIRFRMKNGSTPNEGGHVDDLQVIDLPEPTVQWTIRSNRFETSEGNSPADECNVDYIVHFGTQSPQHKVCLRQDAQNPASADAGNTQGMRLSGEETWIQADGWTMWYVPFGSDLVASFFMDNVNMPEHGYANAWYLYWGVYRRMNGVGVDTSVEAGTRFRFIWDPETIGDWVDVRFWIPWTVNDVNDSHHVIVDDFDLTWYRASHDVIGPFSDQGNGSYTATVTSDLPGTANVTCIYYGSNPPLTTDGTWPSSGPWPVQFQ